MIALNHFKAPETRLRTLLADAGLPEPDEVEYGEASILALWHEPKVAVVVDLEEGCGTEV